MRGFGELEAAVMAVLWDVGEPLLVRDVRERLGRPLAHTTVMTVLDKLHTKGWLLREREGRAYRYRPRLPRAAYVAELMREALGDSGDVPAAFAHFVTGLSEQEASALRQVLDADRGRGGGGDR